GAGTSRCGRGGCAAGSGRWVWRRARRRRTPRSGRPWNASRPRGGCRSFGKSSPYFRMSLSGCHPAIERWFESRFREPTEPQKRAWPLIQAGRNALIAAPTGSGKTFAAFLAAIDSLLRQGLDGGGTLTDGTQVVYVSPLKALSNDVQKNLAEPLAEVRRTLETLCRPDGAYRS